MQRATTGGAMLIALIALIAAAAAAHHGNREYDTRTTVHLEGEVLEFHWRNPHAMVYLGVRGPDGESRRVEIETDGPSGLVPLGVSKTSLVPGDRVIATVSPSHRQPETRVLGSEIVKEDGSVLTLGGRSVPKRLDSATGRSDSIEGTWVPQRAGFFQFLLQRSEWPLRDEARRAFARYNDHQLPQADCVPLDAPTVMVYPTVHQISRRGDRILVDTDWMGAVRTVYLDGRGHPDAAQTFQQGHSIGRFEGDTLIVDTANFVPGASGLTFGIPSSAGKHLVERFSLADDGATLVVSFTLEDPEALRAPVRGEYRWLSRPELEPSGVPCDPETARRYLDLVR